jgi:hypothetical protein
MRTAFDCKDVRQSVPRPHGMDSESTGAEKINPQCASIQRNINTILFITTYFGVFTWYLMIAYIN